MEDKRVAELEEKKKYINDKTVAVKAGQPEKPRIVAEDVLPGYVLKLTGGCKRAELANATSPPCLKIALSFAHSRGCASLGSFTLIRRVPHLLVRAV